MNARGTTGRGRCRGRRPDVRRIGLTLLAMLLVAGLAVVPAHAAGPLGHPHHESSGVPVGILLLAVAGAVFAASARWGRRAAILALTLLVGWFGLETAVHSVHHFWDPQTAASCPLFLASQHADGAGASPAITGVPTWTPRALPTFDDQRIRPLRDFRSHDGRAPPVLPSA